MAWTRIDGLFLKNGKIQRAGIYGMALYLSGLIYCNSALTDGFIDESLLPGLCGESFQLVRRKSADKLVEIGLWEKVNGGYQVHDFLEFNRSKDEIAEINQKRSKAGAVGGNKRAANARQKLSNLPDVCQEDASTSFKQNPTPNYLISLLPNTLIPKKEFKEPPYPPIGGTAADGFPDLGKVFMGVTGMPGIPGGELPKVLPALDALWDSRKYANGDELVKYLKPYYEAWISRRGKNGAFYSRSNCTWLYDWAISGSIPMEIEEVKPKTRKLIDAAGNVVEVPA